MAFPAAMDEVEIMHLLHVKRGDMWRKVDCDFVSEVDGVKYLQLRPTAPWLCALVCGKCPRGMSLAASEQLEALKEKREQAVKTAMQGSAAESLFEGAECRAPKRRKLPPQGGEMPPTVCIRVGQTEVQVAVPSSRGTRADLRVRLEAQQLSAVFAVLAEDCDACQGAAARKYERSGRYQKDRARGRGRGARRGRPRGQREGAAVEQESDSEEPADAEED